ncbi:hypothetical protein FRC06_001314 [Ceratobasidium sp. 370]|nr:hypothetical protein FRC06_001314 [Ceratobasidium sp. 370]
METGCFYCGSGYRCPFHPYISSTGLAARLDSAPAPPTPQFQGGSLPQFNYPPTASNNYIAWTSSEQALPGLHHAVPPSSQTGRKRPAPAAQTLHDPKRLRVPAGAIPVPAYPRSKSQRQIETAQLAAATLPPSYHVHDETEGARRVQAARAID